METIYEKLEAVYKVRDKVALGLIGNPGLAKTSIVEQFAKDKGKKVITIIASQDSPTEISGINMPDPEDKKMKVYDLQRLEELEDGDILFFDEFLNGNIQVLNACLTLITNREMRSGKELPDIMIVAAGNPQGSTRLLPQTKQRFWWTEVTFNMMMWASWVMDNYGFMPPESLLTAIKTQSFDESVEAWTYLTARTADQIIGFVAAGVPLDSPIYKVYMPRVYGIDFDSLIRDVYTAYYKAHFEKVSVDTLEVLLQKLGKTTLKEMVGGLSREQAASIEQNKELSEALKHITFVPAKDEEDDKEEESGEIPAGYVPVKEGDIL